MKSGVSSEVSAAIRRLAAEAERSDYVRGIAAFPIEHSGGALRRTVCLPRSIITFDARRSANSPGLHPFSKWQADSTSQTWRSPSSVGAPRSRFRRAAIGHALNHGLGSSASGPCRRLDHDIRSRLEHQ